MASLQVERPPTQTDVSRRSVLAPAGGASRQSRVLAAGVLSSIVALQVALPGGAATAPTRPTATVGPGFTISLKTRAGGRLASLKAGRYSILVRDRSSAHNFALRGPGVAKATSVARTQTTTWTVTLRAGTYTFVCNPHATAMRGTFKVAKAEATTTKKVNANTASIDELVAVFRANGVPNPESWAREVDEYRPYPTDDPSFAKLRQELSKYNPSATTLARILASLEL